SVAATSATASRGSALRRGVAARSQIAASWALEGSRAVREAKAPRASRAFELSGVSAIAHHPLLEVAPRVVQPRPHGLERAAERLGDLGARQALQLEQHEHL